MVQEEALKPVIELLNKIKIPYMFVGAIAVNYYSVPRFTHDADLVVQIQREHVEDICKSLEDRYYIDRDMIIEALDTIGQFNAIHIDTGFKIDFWIVKEDEVSQTQFVRRIAGKMFRLDVFIITPEDLILTKLTWFKKSDIQKHFLDAVGVYRMQKDILDTDYLKQYAKELKLLELLKEVEKQTSAPSH